MSACWMFMILMGYRLSHAAQSPSTCDCNEQLETVCVPAGDNVTVHCPTANWKEATLFLFKNQEVINNVSCSLENNKTICQQPPTGVSVQLHENKRTKSFTFRLTGVNASHHGIYRCVVTLMFPPPYKKEQSARILVLVEGHQCKDKKDCGNPKTSNGQNSVFPWIWIPLVLLSIYSVIVTIIASVTWAKLRKTDSQSDYINTKPRAPRDRKKKRGIQNPIIPRHF